MAEPSSDAQQFQHQPQEQPKRRPLGLIAALAIAVLAAGGIGFLLGRASTGPSASEVAEAAEAAATSQAEVTRLKDAVMSCRGRDADNTMVLEDDDSTIVIDTGSKYGSTAGMDCILNELDVPASIEAQIGRTTSMMGVQDAEDDGIEYSWSYHPDNGVDMVITDTKAGGN
jgi:hypothetical protein